ncbi:MAG: DUF362 domain-containing protein [Planctomycetales bacterium]|nr:DUF362 domain-containing protein [Planctomycetales bacterium]
MGNKLSLSRRALLVAGGILGLGGSSFVYERWIKEKSRCFVARNQSYGRDLARTIQDGLLSVGFDPRSIRSKQVLLKPNLVEPTRAAPHMTTHPAILSAAIEVFKNWGARICVGEAPGHVRDSEMALRAADIAHVLLDSQTRFADLNYEPTRWSENRGHASKLKGFYFPQSVLEADLIVSMPKLKTHHWMGVTASLKNMYGVIPGSRYGWPKNVLHFNGIPETVVDINASLPPRVSIVDAIDCMEGDGPIMGSKKTMGLVAVGLDMVAVDATLCRIMGMDPSKIPYLQLVDQGVNRLSDWSIEQVGESWQSLQTPFEILKRPELQAMRLSLVT